MTQSPAPSAPGEAQALPDLPEQAGWGVSMHGSLVLFASNVEKASGRSPGATTQLFTADQMRAYAAARIAELEAEVRRLRAEMNKGRVFAGWFRELKSGMSYRLWEQMGHEQTPGDVALYE